MNTELSLNEYIKFARKIAAKYRRSNDEECVSAIVYRLAIAYRKFDGRGIQKAYMYKHGDYACRTYLSKLRSQLQTLSPALPHKTNVEEQVINNDILNKLSTVMTDREHDYIRRYYLDGMTLREIGQIDGFSQEWVRQIIKSGINKAREQFND